MSEKTSHQCEDPECPVRKAKNRSQGHGAGHLPKGQCDFCARSRYIQPPGARNQKWAHGFSGSSASVRSRPNRKCAMATDNIEPQSVRNLPSRPKPERRRNQIWGRRPVPTPKGVGIRNVFRGTLRVRRKPFGNESYFGESASFETNP